MAELFDIRNSWKPLIRLQPPVSMLKHISDRCEGSALECELNHSSFHLSSDIESDFIMALNTQSEERGFQKRVNNTLRFNLSF